MFLYDVEFFEDGVVKSFNYLWEVRLAFDSFEKFNFVLRELKVLFFVYGHYFHDKGFLLCFLFCEHVMDGA